MVSVPLGHAVDECRDLRELRTPRDWSRFAEIVTLRLDDIVGSPEAHDASPGQPVGKPVNGGTTADSDDEVPRRQSRSHLTLAVLNAENDPAAGRNYGIAGVVLLVEVNWRREHLASVPPNTAMEKPRPHYLFPGGPCSRRGIGADWPTGGRMDKPFQRIGAESNTHVGVDFEGVAQTFYAKQGIELHRGESVEIGVAGSTKPHSFDLGSVERKLLIECKCHRWTKPGDNVPSAKLTVWNEAMYYFHLAPAEFTKVLFVLRDLRGGAGESLASYYLRTHAHLVPSGVELWEYDEATGEAHRVNA